MSDDKIEVFTHRPSRGELFFFLISGFLLSVPMTLFFESTAQSFLVSDLSFNAASIVLAVVVAPIMEEFAKIFPMFYRHGETGKSLVTLGFTIGLGFGLSEFVEYVFFYGVSPLLRLPVVLFHSSTTSIAAYGVSIGRTYSYFGLAVLLHFLLNFSASLGQWAFGVYIAVLGVAYFSSSRLYAKASDKFDLKTLEAVEK
jgi:RsiW-degrading membrane proteinase PrsW (M82 family)